MKKCCFIVPFFGRFSNLFDLWLESCKYNPEFDWLIFTDDTRPFQYPSNVHVHYLSFEEFKVLIQKKYNFKISIEKSYRLCNFKPAYGDIFNNYIKDYLYWGFCDIDLIFGQLWKYIKHDFEKYDKIGIFGHLTILKNTDQINKLYTYNNAFKLAFQNNNNMLFFDENSFLKICSKHKIKTLSLEKIANLDPRKSFLTINSGQFEQEVPLGRQIFYWYKGRLQRFFLSHGILKTQDVMYVHFLKRNLQIGKLDLNKPCLIYPNAIINSTETIDKEVVKKYTHTTNRYFFKFFSPAQIKRTLIWRLLEKPRCDKIISAMNKKVYSEPK